MDAGRCERMLPAKLCSRNDITLAARRHAQAGFAPFPTTVIFPIFGQDVRHGSDT